LVGGQSLVDRAVDNCLICCVDRSVKHYFLLDQGDFIVQFMDMAEDEMKKSMEGKNKQTNKCGL